MRMDVRREVVGHIYGYRGGELVGKPDELQRTDILFRQFYIYCLVLGCCPLVERSLELDDKITKTKKALIMVNNVLLFYM